MEKDRGFFSRQKKEFGAPLFRKPSHRRFGVVGLGFSVFAIYWGASSLPHDPLEALTGLALSGLCEGMGALFGSVAELLPEEQTALAGILRVWAGLFVVCGVILIAARLLLRSGALGLWP